MKDKSAPMPLELKTQVFREINRQMDVLVSLIGRWPEHRLAIAYGMLGAAIGTVDIFGGDVEGFLRNLRSTCSKPDVLTPPKGKLS